MAMTSKVQPLTESDAWEDNLCVCLDWGKIVEGDDVWAKVG